MTYQIRYPKKITQENKDNFSKWGNLENMKVDNWESLSSSYLEGESKPSPIYIKDFDFNIPEGAKIHTIEIDHDYHRDTSQNPIEIDPPIIKIHTANEDLEQTSHISADIFPVDRTVVFECEDITSEEINDNNLSVKICFPKNNNENSGYLYFDYVRVKINYEVKRYLLTSGESSSYFPTRDNPINKAIGDEFKYTLSFRNVNGISEDKQKVKISIPEGLEIVNYYYKANKINKLENEDIIQVDDEFDIEKGIWYPSVRGKGVSRIRLVFKCLDEGLKIINAFNENTELTPNFHVMVHPEDYESKISKFEETTNKWATELEDDEDFKLLNKDVAISIDNVSMEFEMAQEKIDNLKEYVIKWIKRQIKPKNKFMALKDVTFTINKGERVGVIGFNGAGKSTLLKILSGVLKPTEGKTYTEGKVAPLLELGAGFDHNYNGRENIFLNGAILGYSKEFLKSKYKEIIDFSELKDFIELPLKNYSSGMVAKLGFSVATIVEPDILLLDEILSVGDVKFQKKSGDKLKSMMGSGTTVLLVSHSTGKIRELCNRVIWLDQGKLVMDGDVDYVCDAYIEAAKKASEEERKDLEFV